MEDKHVLVVDDNEDLRFVVAEVLRGAGYRVSTASDGEEALAAVLRAERDPSEGVDLLLTDFQMPAMTGLELYCRLRGWGIDVPTIVVSSSPAERGPDEMRRRGCTAFLRQPFMPREVIDLVDQALCAPVLAAQAL